jgi:hypothetical protein
VSHKRWDSQTAKIAIDCKDRRDLKARARPLSTLAIVATLAGYGDCDAASEAGQQTRQRLAGITRLTANCDEFSRLAL